MPCYVTGSAEGDSQLMADEARKQATKVTQLLCSLCEHLDANAPELIVPREVAIWWAEHKAIDEAREKARKESETLELQRLREQRQKVDERIRTLES